MEWPKVEEGKRARVRLASGIKEGEVVEREGEVVEVAGRVVGPAPKPGEEREEGRVDPGWARIELDDGSNVTVHQDNIVEILD